MKFVSDCKPHYYKLGHFSWLVEPVPWEACRMCSLILNVLKASGYVQMSEAFLLHGKHCFTCTMNTINKLSTSGHWAQRSEKEKKKSDKILILTLGNWSIKVDRLLHSALRVLLPCTIATEHILRAATKSPQNYISILCIYLFSECAVWNGHDGSSTVMSNLSKKSSCTLWSNAWFILSQQALTSLHYTAASRAYPLRLFWYFSVLVLFIRETITHHFLCSGNFPGKLNFKDLGCIIITYWSHNFQGGFMVLRASVTHIKII